MYKGGDMYDFLENILALPSPNGIAPPFKNAS